ncbi:MAG: ABC transporter ATP-binding protein [Lachnospiraceae bacterium]|nr:ABC transporter ATP-binding protein [Lachnospiraceae bacterium]
MLLEFVNVTGKKGRFKLDNVSFSLPAGYIMGLAGVNGAGKTTLIDYIMNGKKRYTGTIKIDGVDIRENHADMRNLIGFVSDENVFFEDRTCDQNVELMSMFYKDFDGDIYKQAMKDMNVAGGLTLSKMSRGERMKFQMAFAMAHKPAIYLLDEVTAGMDPVFRIDFFRMLHKVIEDEGASVLMTSHIESEMEQKMDYLGVLEEGRLVEFGESLEVLG